MTLKYYQFDSDGTALETSDLNPQNWALLTEPNAKEIELLNQNYEIPEDFISDSLDKDEAPRVEEKDDVVLVIFRYPIKFIDEENDDINYRTAPVGFIFTPKGSIVVSKIPLNFFTDFLHKSTIRKRGTARNTIFLSTMESMTLKYLQYLRQINHWQDNIETQLMEETQNKNLLKLLQLKKSLVLFTTSMKGNLAILNRLRKTLPITREENEELLEDVIIDKKQAIEMSEIYTNIILSTMNTFSSIISNEISTIMKFLTGFTILLMIPNLITSFYGMNISTLPLSNNPHSTLMIFSLCFISIGVVYFVLRHKKLF